MTTRIHNILFALLIGLILGVTVYALNARMPEAPARVLPVEINRKAPANDTEKLIDRGELSNHEATYYRGEEPLNQ